MKANKVRKTFLDYFKNKNHEVVESSSLIPRNDPSLLFTNAGMVPFKDVLLGVEKRSYSRAVSSQKCLRVGGKHNDLDNVGYTSRHHTFFEMLGNFSFGDYFKKEAIYFAWELLIDKYSIPKEKLWITVHREDQESEDIWINDIGINQSRISRLGDEDNFWTMGDTGPCGPCSEIFYDYGPNLKGNPPAEGSDTGDRFVEIQNLVFAQFDRSENGNLKSLPSPCVDTGMGLERMASVLQGKTDNFDSDVFSPLVKKVSEISNTDNLNDPSLKVIADHIRASAFLISEGITPKNEGRGYVLRRIIRRALRHCHKLKIESPVLSDLIPTLVKSMGAAYPDLKKNSNLIKANLLREEEQFSSTLVQGMKLLKEEIKGFSGKVLPADLVFKLYDTYGFPLDMTSDFAKENGLSIDIKGYENLMKRQQERGRESSTFTSSLKESVSLEGKTKFQGYKKEGLKTKIKGIFNTKGKEVTSLRQKKEGLIFLEETPFYAESGGQVGDSGVIVSKGVEFSVQDTQKIGDHLVHIGSLKKGSLKNGMSVEATINNNRRKRITANHSATHLLNSALKRILGSDIEQRGSLVDEHHLRFDFTSPKAVTDEQIREIETLVNEEITKNTLTITETMSKDEALKKGALAFFGEKYGEKVRVLSLGKDFSIELCGGTHVKRTGDIGLFTITNESSISAGVRRLEAVTGEAAISIVQSQEQNLKEIATFLNTSSDQVSKRVQQLLKDNKDLKKKLNELHSNNLGTPSLDLISSPIKIGKLSLVAKKIDDQDSNVLRKTADSIRNNKKNMVVVLISSIEEKIPVVVALSKDLNTLDATVIMSYITNQLGGSGGGRKDFAQGGVEKEEDIEFVLSSLKDFIISLLNN